LWAWPTSPGPLLGLVLKTTKNLHMKT